MGVGAAFTGGKMTCGRRLCVLAAAAIFAVVLAAPAGAQFDFLFGPRHDANPPPAEAKPSGASGSQTKQGRGRHHKSKHESKTQAKSPAAPAANPAGTEEPLPPYEPELLRLAEILGSLTYLDELCAVSAPGGWRAKMQGLIDTEAKGNARKERLSGSYNRGFRDFERTYRFCTPNAQAAIDRFLAEGSKIAREVVNRYGAS
jgi:uncharacterized protein (TIGR02301 family)